MNKQLNVQLETIDFWGRVQYKVQDRQVYLTNLEILFPNKDIAPNNDLKKINDYFKEKPELLIIHNVSINDDPLGTPLGKDWKVNVMELNKEKTY